MDDVLFISKEFAKSVIVMDRKYRRSDSDAEGQQAEHTRRDERLDGCSWDSKTIYLQVLVLLEEAGRLPFTLQEVLDEMSRGESDE